MAWLYTARPSSLRQGSSKFFTGSHVIHVDPLLAHHSVKYSLQVVGRTEASSHGKTDFVSQGDGKILDCDGNVYAVIVEPGQISMFDGRACKVDETGAVLNSFNHVIGFVNEGAVLDRHKFAVASVTGEHSPEVGAAFLFRLVEDHVESSDAQKVVNRPVKVAPPPTPGVEKPSLGPLGCGEILFLIAISPIILLLAMGLLSVVASAMLSTVLIWGGMVAACRYSVIRQRVASLGVPPVVGADPGQLEKTTSISSALAVGFIAAGGSVLVNRAGLNIFLSMCAGVLGLTLVAVFYQRIVAGIAPSGKLSSPLQARLSWIDTVFVRKAGFAALGGGGVFLICLVLALVIGQGSR